jgi:hypothetical protein
MTMSDAVPSRAERKVIRDYLAHVPIGRIEKASGLSRYAIESLVERFEDKVREEREARQKKNGSPRPRHMPDRWRKSPRR